ncbi:MAG: SpoIIE family protein phosphatase [Bacillota bacterium]
MSQPDPHWAVAQLPLAGEAEAGDQCLVKTTPSGVLIAVADGLGHGSEAAQAARTALTTADGSSHEPLPGIMRRCHAALLRTRGAVVALASADTATRTLVWLGVGNILAVLVRGGARRAPAREWLTCRSGTVGYRLPAVLRPSTTSLDPGDLLVLATDGIRDGFAEDIDPAWEPQHAANHVLSRWARGGDDALVLAVRFP